ncbi:hypothetical protein C0J52_05847 [Blattella germanica]|nr:hypothetical protein C0J52_05847 [Blattella germanica]
MKCVVVCFMLLYLGMCMGLPCTTLQNITLNLSAIGLDSNAGHLVAKQGKKICEEDGGHLLVLNSDAEAEGVNTLLAKHALENLWIWIGFHDRYEEGNYVTIFNETLREAGYLNWASGEPSHNSGQDCGVIKYRTGLGVGVCDLAGRPFICEIEL